MKLLQINGGVFGSTGNIMFGIAKKAQEAGIETLCVSPVTATNKNREPKYPYIKIGSYNSRRASVMLSRITGYNGCFAYWETKKLLKTISDFAPDVIHLHNLHDSYINLPMLFDYIKKHKIRTFWTLHDCWSFTGHCVHFTISGCDKWKSCCSACPSYKGYPASYLDNSKKMHRLKKQWFLGVDDMTLITPSKWLNDLVKQSFLKDYPAVVVNNGIDLDVFKPTESDFRKKYGLEDKKIVLGVSFGWGYSKGLDVFIDLANRLPEDYKVVLVGTNDDTDRQLPKSIISIHQTQNQAELAEIYSAADVFANPTREENYPTVNMEALACGTPVVTFKTGGSPEIIDESCGSVVAYNDKDAMLSEVLRVCEDKPYSKDACLKRAENFSFEDKFSKVVEMYLK